MKYLKLLKKLEFIKLRKKDDKIDRVLYFDDNGLNGNTSIKDCKSILPKDRIIVSNSNKKNIYLKNNSKRSAIELYIHKAKSIFEFTPNSLFLLI